MVSRRYRSNASVGKQVSTLRAQMEDVEKQNASGLGVNEVTEDNLDTNSVGSDAIKPDAVTGEHIARGAVGTNELGIVNEINSDGDVRFNLPGHAVLDGASYTKPSAGAISQLALDENGKIVLGGGSEALAVGSVIDWAGGTLPENWLACDGSAISRATYNALFQAIGTTYGAGNGTTTFNLPNKPAGYGAGRIGRFELAANATTSSTTDVAIGTGVSLTVPVISGRQYRIMFDPTYVSSSVNGDQVRFNMRANGTSIKYHYQNMTPANLGATVAFSTSYTATSTGNVTFDVLWAKVAGSGTITAGSATGSTTNVELVVVDEAESSAKFTHMIKYQQGISMGGGGGGGASVTVSDFAPVSATGGDLWFYSVDGTLFTYYNDGDSAQWIEVGDVVASAEPNSVPAGSIVAWTSNTIPNNWLLCDGSAVSRSTYASLFNAIGTTYGVGNGTTTFNLPDLSGRVIVGKKTPTSLGTATVTIAAPGVVTLAAHGLADGFKVYLTTTGALPTGLTASTEYYVVNATASTIQLATTLGGTAITTTGTQSGTHTLWSSDFDLAETGGTKAHSHWASNMVAAVYVGYTKFKNGLVNWTATNSGGLTAPGASSTSTTNGVSIEGSTDPGSNLQPYITLNYIIKVSAAETPGDSMLATRVGALETYNALNIPGVVPASVTVGAGSASVAADGTVSFTNVSSVSLNDVFNGLDKDTYRIFGQITSMSGTSVTIRSLLRTSAGTDASSVYNYRYNIASDWGSTWSTGGATSGVGFCWIVPSGVSSGFADARFDYMVYRPNLAVLTTADGRSTQRAGNQYRWDETGDNSNSTAYSSWTLMGGGTSPLFSGWIKVVKVA